MQQLIQVDCGYFCCGVIVEFPPEDGLVVQAAPIMRWALGKSFRDITKFVSKRRGKWTVICEDNFLEFDCGKNV